MWELFSTDAGTSGFRLHYMELLNWGTFNGEVVRIAPEGNNALLTGANASCKSTFIYALLTLLVQMQRKRFYNQSSGVEKKGDRSEETYVLGHYGNILKEGSVSTTSQMLRHKSEVYSVLLASFANINQKVVTLFQLRWFSNGELRRSFGLAHCPLEIAKDFDRFDPRGEWRKRLENTYNIDKTKRKLIEFFDGPKGYAERMQKLFGMRSENALSLFNQMVGVKVLDDLDEFIRTNMLEEREVEEKYADLKKSFFTLMEAKNNIEKAKYQIILLEPICQHIDTLVQTYQTADQLQHTQAVSAYWFAQQYLALADAEISKQNKALSELKETLDQLQLEEVALSSQQLDLERDIRNDEVGRQIEALKKERDTLLKTKEYRRYLLNEYNQLAQQLALIEDPSADDFAQNRDKVALLKQRIEDDEEKRAQELANLQNNTQIIAQNVQNLKDNIRILHKNCNNIAGQEATIRDEILQAIGASKEEIPFIGELLKVREEERQWEYAIEKVLHTAALHLIVPPQYYSKVNTYVNTHKLKGRIRYYKYEAPAPNLLNRNESTSVQLWHKIEIKPLHPYADWLEQLIVNQHNFYCVNSLADFEKYKEMCLTPEGLVKYRKGRHEKDDRAFLSARSNYVLGWDNKEKIKSLTKELNELQTQKEQTDQQIAELKEQREYLRKQGNNISVFRSKFEKYEAIYWQECALQIQEKETEIQTLEKTNDRIKALQQQLSKLQQRHSKLKDTIKSEERKSFNIEREIKIISDKKASVAAAQEECTPEDTTAFLQTYPQLQQLVFDTFEQQQTDFQKQLTQNINENDRLRSKKEQEVIKGITEFKNPTASVLEKFKDWASDVNTLPTTMDIRLLSEYSLYLSRLKKDNLPKYEKKFQEYLHETTIHKIGGFGTFFDTWSDKIRENIRHLNDSLREINFKSNPDTYIQLVIFPRQNADIAEFRELLRKARANINEISNRVDGRKDHFENHIAPFIKRLEDEQWRKKVLDVRQWSSYKAEEFYKENGTKAKTYEGMGQLSGGEKAQLTYTILGSAIAYQFGLLKDGLETDSFRFIAIDEAFKAQDEDKARYLITLCKQLHLQLLVVTPSDNIHIVENDIAFVHFVSRAKDETSHLINMPISQFKEERQKFLTND